MNHDILSCSNVANRDVFFFVRNGPKYYLLLSAIHMARVSGMYQYMALHPPYGTTLFRKQFESVSI